MRSKIWSKLIFGSCVITAVTLVHSAVCQSTTLDNALLVRDSIFVFVVLLIIVALSIAGRCCVGFPMLSVCVVCCVLPVDFRCYCFLFLVIHYLAPLLLWLLVVMVVVNVVLYQVVVLLLLLLLLSSWSTI